MVHALAHGPRTRSAQGTGTAADNQTLNQTLKRSTPDTEEVNSLKA